VPWHVRDSPFSPIGQQLTVPGLGGPVIIRPYYPVVWISITPPYEPLPSHPVRFLAAVDTAHTASLSIREEHLRCLCDAEALPPLDPAAAVFADGRRRSLPRLQGEVWLHGQDSELWLDPIPLGIQRGIIFSPATLSAAEEVAGTGQPGEGLVARLWRRIRGQAVARRRAPPPQQPPGPDAPLIGALAFRSLGLKVEVNYDTCSLGIWLPERNLHKLPRAPGPSHP
jgi:hypothetical protein